VRVPEAALRLRRFAPALVALLILLVASPALGDPRYDHHGSLGLLAGGGVEIKTQQPADTGWRYDADLGATLSVGSSGNDLKAFARAGFGGEQLDLSLVGGYRGYFGYDRLKTFLDLDAVVHFAPLFSAGPRVGFGVQLELTQVIGAFLGLAGQITVGPSALRFDGELFGGLQLRSYLFE
jgi:hypothetical protein